MPETSSDPLLQPMTVGTIETSHRIVIPPHAGGRGRPLASEEHLESHIAYWGARAAGGIDWLGGGPAYVRNPVIPGFEPTGVGAHADGNFRDDAFIDRLGRWAAAMHDLGAAVSTQMVLQGGTGIAPSQTLSGYQEHVVPHALDRTEIAWLVDEYIHSARCALDVGVDAIELHTNHDDVLHWFLSPMTNQRDDTYGRDLEGRRRIVREICGGLRETVGRPFTLGLRLTLDEAIDGGYDLDGCLALVEAFEADGDIDYVSVDVGSNWGAPSYIPTAVHEQGQWAPYAARLTRQTDLPVIYTGRVVAPDVARRIVAEGHADLVGMVRALIAEPDLVRTIRGEDEQEQRPCIGLNDCIDRLTVNRLPFACGTNPQAGVEETWPTEPLAEPRRVAIVGGGPAGLELAGLTSARGHQVTLLERDTELGGQLRTAALARANREYQGWIDWQAKRLERLGVDVRLGTEADRDHPALREADVVAVATGGVPRRPDIAGIDADHVLDAVDVLRGAKVPGAHVVVVAEDDRAVPLAVADHLAGDGYRVTLLHRSLAPSPQVGRYTNGSLLARLDNAGVRIEAMARAVAVTDGAVQIAHAYSGRRWTLDGVDAVVLACGAVSDDRLYHELEGIGAEVHVLGDAYAPRRVSFATRQAYALTLQLG